jgi:hypothetical protein
LSDATQKRFLCSVVEAERPGSLDFRNSDGISVCHAPNGVLRRLKRGTFRSKGDVAIPYRIATRANRMPGDRRR